jgi:ABC-type transporter Mla maintaining outer membrane lipid asymmetry ATPase subunit MlaF
LGRALAVGPELLLLDNPLAGMDRYHLSWWRQFLARLAQGHPILGSRPLTLVVTADDPRPWVEPHRKAALIDDGRWRLVGTLETAQAEHSATFTDWLQPD